MDAVTVHAAGAALGQWIVATQPDRAVVIGMDTRESGSWIAEQVAGGLARHDITVEFAGITTTPGVAYLAKMGRYAAGVMISASHNPYRDNGIKILAHSGYKVTDQQEEVLEANLFAFLAQGVEPKPAPLKIDEHLDQVYIEHLASTVEHRLDGLTLAVDCANGSAAHLAPELFERLGAKVIRIGCKPDGRNINLNCGSLHLESLRELEWCSGIIRHEEPLS